MVLKRNVATNARRKTAAEMKHMIKTAGHIWSHYETNTEIEKRTNITPVLDKIGSKKENGCSIQTECIVRDCLEY